MQVTATQAKNRFGYVCAQAKIEPVFVEKDGRIDSVIVSVEHFELMQAAGKKKSLASRKKDFNASYTEWIASQNAHFEKHGPWCDGLVPWMESS
ncbi:MAG: type II toxin-antitoxin system Phd/YefM family antitoxin [Polaromonas sp.]|nr:type II toxin-antitoxin system Phd/YefM family antitoxin [Polaromonas sp.]